MTDHRCLAWGLWSVAAASCGVGGAKAGRGAAGGVVAVLRLPGRAAATWVLGGSGLPHHRPGAAFNQMLLHHPTNSPPWPGDTATRLRPVVDMPPVDVRVAVICLMVLRQWFALFHACMLHRSGQSQCKNTYTRDAACLRTTNTQVHVWQTCVWQTWTGRVVDVTSLPGHIAHSHHR